MCIEGSVCSVQRMYMGDVHQAWSVVVTFVLPVQCSNQLSYRASTWEQLFGFKYTIKWMEVMRTNVW